MFKPSQILISTLCLGICHLAQAGSFFNGEPANSDSPSCDEPCEPKWDASIEFGYSSVSGNKDTESVNGRFSLSYEIEKWRHAGFVAANTSSSHDNLTGDQTDTEKYVGQVKSDYKYSKNSYAFGVVDYDDSKYSGFDYQASYAFGGGYRFLNDAVHQLDAELGFGSRQSKEELTGLSNSEAITRLAGLYKWKISQTANFEQKLSTEVGDDNTVSKSLSALSAQLVENLSMKLSYSVKHQSDVPVGNEKRETITSFTIVYSF